MKATKRINVEVLRKKFLPTIDAVQFVTGLQIILAVRDFSIPTGTTAKAFFKKPSGKFVYQDCTISGNEITIDVHNQALTEYGSVYYQVKLTNGSDILSTFAGKIEVEKSIADSSATTSETVVPAFDAAVQNAVAEIEEARDSAITYIGNGLDNTLKVEGKAADAAAAGKAIDELKGDLGDIVQCGKNLFNSFAFQSIEIAGITLTLNNDGTIVASVGTTVANINLLVNTIHLEVGKYIFTALQDNMNEYGIIATLRNSDGSFIANLGVEDYVLSVTNPIDLGIYVTIQSGTTITELNNILSPMVRTGTEKNRTYEPYMVTPKDYNSDLIDNINKRISPIGMKQGLYVYEYNSLTVGGTLVITEEGNNEGYLHTRLTVKRGDIIHIETYGGDANRNYVYTDVNNRILALGLPTSEGIYDLSIDVDGFLYLNDVTTYNHQSYFIKASSFNHLSGEWNGKKWVCIGDSLTEYNDATDLHYFDYISDNTGIEIINKGISGTGYYNAGLGDTFYNRVISLDTVGDVITILGGINDASYPLGNITDTDTNTVCGCINTTISNLYHSFPLANLGIITPPPTDCRPLTEENNSLELLANALVEIGRKKGIPVLDLYHCSGLRPWDSVYRDLCYTKDNGHGTHPNEIGHKIISTKVKSFLNTLLN